MKNPTITDIKKSYTKIVIMLVLLVLTKVSCQDSSTLAPEVSEEGPANVEEVLAKKLGPDQTLEDWGVTKEEFEKAYNAIYNGIIKKPNSKTKSSTLQTSLTPTAWESDYGVKINVGDDYYKKVDIGFPFTFYGKPFTELWVNANGNITLGQGNGTFQPTTIPDIGGKVIIAPLYGDFDPSHASSPSEIYDNTGVYVNTIGSAPNQTFVVTWLDVPAWDWPGPYLPGLTTFQVQLSEGSNSILFGYKELSVTGVNEINGKPMNVGISDGVDRFINSASGEAISELEGTNICYLFEEGEYIEIFGACSGNRPPVAVAGEDQTVECEGESTVVSLDGSGSSDPEGEPITYSWSLDGTEFSTDSQPSLQLTKGSYTITLTVTDVEGDTGSDEVVVDVVDTTAPELTYTVNAINLWPPNGDMHLAVSDISTSDICDSDPSLQVIVTDSADSVETGWDIVEHGDGTFDVYLQATKAEIGDRIYTVAIQSQDASGNIADETVSVTVPHNRSGSQGSITRFGRRF